MTRRPVVRARSALREVVALVVALAVITGMLLGGHTYFYCAPMHRVAFEDCCARHGVEAAGEEARRDQASTAIDAPPHRCCRERTFATSDEGSGPASPPSISPPALVHVLPAVRHLAGALPARVLQHRGQDSRAGPPHASPSSWRVPIDVSLS